MTYEYLCKFCGTTFDRWRPMAEATKRTMCKCGKRADKLFSSGNGVVTWDKGRIGKNGGMCDSFPGPPVFVKNRAHFRELAKLHSKDGAELTPIGL